MLTVFVPMIHNSSVHRGYDNQTIRRLITFKRAYLTLAIGYLTKGNSRKTFPRGVKRRCINAQS